MEAPQSLPPRKQCSTKLRQPPNPQAIGAVLPESLSAESGLLVEGGALGEAPLYEHNGRFHGGGLTSLDTLAKSMPSTRSISCSGGTGVRSTSTVQTLGSRASHPLEDRRKLLSCVRLLKAGKFLTLPQPWPRAQDLPVEHFSKPSAGDQVISVSHAWRSQAHPDPTGEKTRLLCQIFSQPGFFMSDDQRKSGGGDASSSSSAAAAASSSSTESSTLLFLDFVSIPQRPFCLGQPDRTEEETWQFRQALECMHEVYFFSDRIIHLPDRASGGGGQEEVPGEGQECLVPSAQLASARFAQIGDKVQVAGFSESSHPTRAARALTPPVLVPGTVHLFDQVLAVDDEAVTSIDQLEALLSGNAAVVRLRCHPYGLSCRTPADDRGWVFLERFLTMVKCAMMDEDVAQYVVITPSEKIFQQILLGADRLRQASLQDSKSRSSGELKKVLDDFTLELQQKHFSPASTDKREREMGHGFSMKEDRHVVCGVMRHFVSHLSEHWEMEAARQRSFGRKLLATVENTKLFVLEWDCFSEEYSARLTEASTPQPWPVALVLFLPLIPSSILMLFPYASPDHGDWRSQLAWWGFGAPGKFLTCVVGLPLVLAGIARVDFTRRVIVRFLVWAFSCITLSTLLTLATSIALDAFPAPLVHFIGVPVASCGLPLLWWCIPQSQRGSKQLRWKLVYSIGALMHTMGLFTLGFPLLNSAIPLVSVPWQAAIVSAYMFAKLGYEAMALKLSRLVGADAMPYFALMANLAYQINLCVAFSRVSSGLIVAEQICFDTIENIYHLLSIWRQEPGTPQEQYIVASLVLREFLELMVPSQFLIMYLAIKNFRPESSSLFCMRGDRAAEQTQFFLVLDITVEFVVSCLTYLALVYRGHRPLMMLRGLIATRLVPVTGLAASIFMFFMAMEHSHWGMDLSFKWAWVFEERVHWECGLTWTTG